MVVTFVRKAWVDKILLRLRRSVTRTPITKTTDFGGSETLTAGTPVTVYGVFFRRSQKWTFDKGGTVEHGDAYFLFDPATYTVNKNDLITVDSRDYRVQDVVVRYSDDSQSTAVYKYCTLFLNS